MKKLNLLLFMSLFLGVTLFTSCSNDDEDPTYNAPSIVVPSNSTVTAGESVTLEFSYTAEAGFSSASVSATNGTAEISTNGTTGATSGTIAITYTASSEGAGSVLLTIVDAAGNSDEATVILTVDPVQTEFAITSNITENTTWSTGNVYVLKTRVAVTNGATLTIEPGVIIKGDAGSDANATALIIARGSMIDAEGTAEAPIIFTSVADNIMPGEIASPNMDPTLNGLWGGLIILGNGHISPGESADGIYTVVKTMLTTQVSLNIFLSVTVVLTSAKVTKSMA
jgi:hypothetical protein